MTSSGAVAYVGGVVGPVNPGGTCGWGYALFLDGYLVEERFGCVEPSVEMTTAVADYVAAGLALKACLTHEVAAPLVVTPSRQVVMQMSGAWQVRGGPYVPVYLSVRALVGRFTPPVRWEIAHADGMRGLNLARFALQGSEIRGA